MSDCDVARPDTVALYVSLASVIMNTVWLAQTWNLMLAALLAANVVPSQAAGVVPIMCWLALL